MNAPTLLKVMSFNLRTSDAEDGVNQWERRKSLALTRIHAFDPDLLGLQECRGDAQADFVKASLPGHAFHGMPRGGEGNQALEMAPLLVSSSAFQTLQQGHFWLSETPQVPGSKGWDAVFPRTVSWARLLHLPSGRSVTFVNTHFDYQPAAILGAARLLRQWLDPVQQSCAVILSGDFNADKDSTAFKVLVGEGGLGDAWRQAHPDPGEEGTFHDFGRSVEPAPIDWILVSEHFRVVEATLERRHEGALFPSDHYPLEVVLEWIERP